MDEKDRCKKCKGNRVMDVEKVIQLPLEKGVPDEHDYTFYGESDEVVRTIILLTARSDGRRSLRESAHH